MLISDSGLSETMIIPPLMVFVPSDVLKVMEGGFPKIIYCPIKLPSRSRWKTPIVELFDSTKLVSIGLPRHPQTIIVKMMIRSIAKNFT